MAGRGTCPPLLHVDGRRIDAGLETALDCQPLVDNMLDHFADDNTRVIVLTAFFEQYRQAVRLTSPDAPRVELRAVAEQTLRTLARTGKQIVMAYDVPEVPRSCYRRQFPIWDRQPHLECTVSRKQYESTRRELADAVRIVSSESANVVAYDPATVFCTADRCGEIDTGHMLYTTDGNHLNTLGAERLAVDFERFLAPLLHSR